MKNKNDILRSYFVINTEIIKRIMELEKSIGNNELVDEINRLIKIIEFHGNKHKFVNAGLLKAGKSSLFNAIIGKDEFFVDGIRATVKSQSFELDNYILIDTPGLDANDADTSGALEAYIDADTIVFVHDAVEGELNKIEIDSIRNIGSIFDNLGEFISSSILVLSHTDQIENSDFNMIAKVVNEQCNNLFNAEFGQVVSVNSKGYLKVISENKKLLVESSNINTLKNLLDVIEKNDNHILYFYKYIKNYANEICSKLSNEIIKGNDEKNKLSNIDESVNLIKSKDIINEKVNRFLAKIIKENSIPPIERNKLYFSCDTRSYKDYKSEYDARKYAKTACEDAIKSAATASRSQAFNLIAYYENYVERDGKINEIKNEFYNIYNDIKEFYFKSVKKSSNVPAFNIKLKDDSMSNNLLKKVKDTYDWAKWISVEMFNSSNYYLTRYDCNMNIDYDYKTEYVSGLFGDREKEVKYYNWEIEGAIDDIRDEAVRFIEDRTESAKESAKNLYKYYIDDFIEQFKNLVTIRTD